MLQTIGMVIMTGFAAASAVTMAEQFPAEVRVTGIALPYALSVTLFGGTAPYFITAMGGWAMAPRLDLPRGHQRDRRHRLRPDAGNERQGAALIRIPNALWQGRAASPTSPGSIPGSARAATCGSGGKAGLRIRLRG